MSDDTRGGDDTLTGGGAFFAASLYGDASTMDGNSRGGNDTLTGGANAALLLAMPTPCMATAAAAMTA